MMSRSKGQTNDILFTDFYQLTMSQLYFRAGLHELDVQFDHFFRNYPDYGSHQAGYCINAGLETFLDWMGGARFGSEQIEYVRGLRTATGAQMFGEDFLAWLGEHGHFGELSIRAIPEGRVVHPNTPLTVVQGPLAMAQIVETSLLNHLNFQTLIATKAARINDIGQRNVILEFGLRRAQGKGAGDGSRAAIIGGANFTSNVAASKALGLPPKGTHAHSMVQLFMTLGMGELGAFQAYADLYPDDCLLLVDTIDTLESGIPNAIRVFEGLRKKGHEPVGIRLDSGDQAFLSIQAAQMLDAAGFPDAVIVMSSDLDELVIWQITSQIAREAPRYGLDADKVIERLVYGVGTRLITSWGEPALGGVYKLVAVRQGSDWGSAIKVSDSPVKTPNPGNKRLWRLYDERQKASADLISLHDEDPRQMANVALHHPMDHTKFRSMRAEEISRAEPLLVDVVEKGKLVDELPSLDAIRALRRSDTESLDPGIRRLVNPHVYHVSLSRELWQLKEQLIDSARRQNIASDRARPAKK